MPKKKYVYDKVKADRAVDFINGLCHVHGEFAGKPFNIMSWQEKIIRDIFGTVKVSDGYRRYNTAFIFTPKKNAKSELASAVALYLLCADGEYSAEIYGAAANKDQASIIFKTAAQMVRMTPSLSKRVKILEANKRLVYAAANSFYQVLSADVPGKHGLNATGVIVDELLAQPNRDLYDVLTKGAGDARRQTLNFILSTAGTDKRSICYEVYQKAKEVLEGKRIDETFYPVLFGAEEGDNWEDEKIWKKANPALGTTFTIDKLRAAYQSAKGNLVEEKHFRQFRLNIWSEDVGKWMPMSHWSECVLEYNEHELYGKKCWGGLDLSMSQDLTAFVLVFPPDDYCNKYRVLPYFWVPKDGLHKRETLDRAPFEKWVLEQQVFACEGPVVDYDDMERHIIDCSKKFNLQAIATDRWNCGQVADNLEAEGLTIIAFGQGYKEMSNPTKEFMRFVLCGDIAHNNHDCLNWNMQNLIVTMDAAGNIKPDKQRSTERIDGAVALIMALDIAIKKAGEKREQGGLVVLDLRPGGGWTRHN